MKLNYRQIQILKDWIKEHKLSKEDAALLIEAYRRYHSFHQGEDLRTAWVGLGDGKEYEKSKYFRNIHNMSDLTHSCWWGLTDEGVEVLDPLLTKLSWDTDLQQSLFIVDVKELS